MLPRWHQDDRGHERRGLRMYADAGAYARLPVWDSREHWHTVVVAVAVQLHADKLHRRISPEMFKRIARVKSGYAEQRTGRRCIVRPDTLASVVGCSERHVENYNRIARQIGLEKVVMVGGMLTRRQRAFCYRRGSRQRGLSTEVALLNPFSRRLLLWVFTPTGGTPRDPSSHLNTGFLDVATGDKKDATPSRLPTRRARHAPGRRLAAQMVRIVPWLAAERPARCAAALTPFATCEPGWSAQELSVALADVVRRRGHNPGRVTADHITTRPAVVLASLLRDLDPVADHPRSSNMTTPRPVEVEPVCCDRPDCRDGWLGQTFVDVAAGDLVLMWPQDYGQPGVPCPDCDPRVRRGLTVAETAERPDLYAD
ncbi:hypothetical protein VV01_00170 [Luteipulveratus halotolerans]|uniref:Uncharacterized protein n=1 Tax=Luteipulveratus halotolerans TaxID=1631356 RepID=A0A0L6CQ73_9MICO|nr:hypothetical protein VV01_00170 [Luteipulveratus halotolerans]